MNYLKDVLSMKKILCQKLHKKEIGFNLDTFESNKIKITHLCYGKNLKFAKQIKTPEKVFQIVF